MARTLFYPWYDPRDLSFYCYCSVPVYNSAILFVRYENDVCDIQHVDEKQSYALSRHVLSEHTFMFFLHSHTQIIAQTSYCHPTPEWHTHL